MFVRVDGGIVLWRGLAFWIEWWWWEEEEMRGEVRSNGSNALLELVEEMKFTNEDMKCTSLAQILLRNKKQSINADDAVHVVYQGEKYITAPHAEKLSKIKSSIPSLDQTITLHILFMQNCAIKFYRIYIQPLVPIRNCTKGIPGVHNCLTLLYSFLIRIDMHVRTGFE